MGATICPQRNQTKQYPVPKQRGAYDKVGTRERPQPAQRNARPETKTKRFEAGLNSDAPAFHPTEGPALRRARAAAADTPTAVDPNDPEWVQYLAKKQIARNPPPPPPPPPPKAPAGPVTLQTSEYLKLLKAGNPSTGGNSDSKARSRAPVIPPGTWQGQDSPACMTDLKNDLAGALNSIIRARGEREVQQACDQLARKKKATPLKKVIMQERGERGPDSQASAMMRIAQMLEGGTWETQAEEEAEVPENVALDDMYAEAENQDQDLAELAYWSEDEHAPRAIHRPSAHKIGLRGCDNRIIRDYVTQKVGPDLDKIVAMLLLNLRRLNDRHRTFEPATSPRRRFVIGIKEVFRSVKNQKAQCIIVAPDIEEIASAGGLDERVRDILRVAYEQDIPVIFALSRVRVGRALAKNLRMSVLAVLDVKGTKSLFDEAVSLAFQKRVEWLAEQPAKPKDEPPAKAKMPDRQLYKAGQKESVNLASLAKAEGAAHRSRGKTQYADAPGQRGSAPAHPPGQWAR